MPHPPRSTLFPYTTLFRSEVVVSENIAQRLTNEFASRFSPGKVYASRAARSEEHTSELQSLRHLVCRLLLEKKKKHHPDPDQHKPAAEEGEPNAHADQHRQ